MLPATASPVLAPAPTTLGFATPPYFGITQQQQQLSATVPGLAKVPVPTGPLAGAAPSTASLNWLGSLTGGAVSAANDPRQWTPDQAAAQTDRALARIGQANPELAQALAEQHGVAQPQDGGGFFHGLLHAVGSVMHATHLDTVFEVMGRSAHLVPEILDHPDTSIWTSMATALAGHSTTSWDDVLNDQLGIKHGLLSSVVGLVGDFATDPLTYLTFGGGALGRDLIGKTVGVAGIEAAGSAGKLGPVWERAAASVAAGLGSEKTAAHLAAGTFDTQVAKAIWGLTEPGTKLAEQATSGLVGKVRTALGMVHPDAKSAALLTLSDVGGKQAILDTVQMADNLFTTATTIGWQRATAQAAEKMGVDKALVDDVLKTYISRGSGIADKAAYETGKAAAAARGGIRLRMSIPVLDLRMAGMRLPFLPANLDFSIGRRFFAGLSGETRLMKMLGTDATVTLEHVNAFWKGGWDGLKDYSRAQGDNVADRVGRGVRSMFYTASDGVGGPGGLTAKFSAHDRVLRGGGLAARYAQQAGTMGAHIRSQSKGDLMRVTLGEGDAVTVLDAKAVGERLGAGELKAGESAEQLTDLLNKRSALVPVPGVSAADHYAKVIQDFRDAARQTGNEDTPEFQSQLARLMEQQKEAVQAEADIEKLTGDADYGEIWTQVAHNVESGTLDAGQLPDTFRKDFAERVDVNPEDAAQRLSPDGQAFRFPEVSAASEIGVRQLGDVSEEGTMLRGLHGVADGAIGDQPDLLDPRRLTDISKEVSSDPADPLRKKIATLKAGTPSEVEAQLTPTEALQFRAARQAQADRAAGRIEAPHVLVQAVNTPVRPGNVTPEDALSTVLANQDDIDMVEKGLSRMAREAQQDPELLDSYEKVQKALDRINTANERGLEVPLDKLAQDLEGVDPQLLPDITGGPIENLYGFLNRGSADVVNVSPVAAGRQHLADTMALADEYAAARRATLTQEQTDYLLRPRSTFIGPRRTLHIDHSGRVGETTSDLPVDPITDFQNEMKPVLEAIKKGKQPDIAKLPEDIQAVVKKYLEADGNFEAQMADMTTEYVKTLGYTDVEILGKDGRTHVVALMDKSGNIPVARLNPGAGRVASGGPQLRAVTSDVRHAIEGVDKSGNTTLVRKVLRKTAGMPDRQQAEARAADILRKAGVKLKAGQQVFETKPLSIIESATDETANRVVREFMGRAMRNAENLGLMRGGYTPDLVGVSKKRFVAMEGTKAMDYFDRLRDEEKQARVTAAKVSDEDLARMNDEALRFNDEALARQKEYEDLVDNQTAREQAIVFSGERKRNDMDAAEGTAEEKAARREENAQYIDDISNRQVQWMRQHGGELRPGQLVDDPESGLRGHIFQGWEHMRDVSTDDGVGSVWRLSLRMKRPLAGENAAKHDLSETHIYFALDENGRTQAIREVSAQEPLTGDYARAVENGANPAAFRSVTAITHPNAERKGWGAALHTTHWDDASIHSVDDMLNAITFQSLSKSGTEFNLKMFRGHYAELKADAKRADKDAKRVAEQASRAFNAAKIEHDDAQRELGRMFFRSQHDRAPALVALHPAEDANNMTGMVRIKLPGFEGYSMPAFMAQEFEHAMRGFPHLDGAHRAFRQFNSWWKTAATWLWPGFHIRNIEGAFFNNWLGGVGLKSYQTAFRIRMAAREIASGEPGKWAGMKVAAKDPKFIEGLLIGHPEGVLYGKRIEELTYADLHAMSSGMNLTASNGRAFAEAMLPAEAEARKFTNRKRFTDRITPYYTKPMRGAGTMTENIMRLASWSHGIETGRNMWESRAFTMMRHGDYEDLTDFEYSVVRDLIPFYKWMRTNTPFQVHQLLESPAKLLGVQKAQAAVFSAQGLDIEQEKHRMPGWMGDSFIVPWGKHLDASGLTTYDTVNFDLPMADMFMSGREFISSFLPTVRPFLESYIYHQQTFSGKPLTGKPVPLNPILTPLSGLLSAVGLVERGKDGSPFMTDQTNNILSIIPIYSRFKDWIMADDKSVEKRSHALASAAFGLALRPVDASALSSTELNFYYDQILPTMEYMKALGYNLPTTDDLSAVGQTTDTVLKGLGIQPGPVAATAA